MFTKISYKTTVNLGNYENEVIDLEYSINEDESVEDAFDIVKATALELVGVKREKQDAKKQAPFKKTTTTSKPKKAGSYKKWNK